MSGFSVVTLSKGRLHHLKQTLPTMMSLGADDVIVVDYGCPDGSGEWAEAAYPKVKVVRVDDDPGFCASRARNRGASETRSEWLLFVDADVKCSRELSGWMRENLQARSFYRAEPIGRRRVPETYGTFICARSDFDAIGGFDEVFRDWGGEDDDLYARLRTSGAVGRSYPNALVSGIPHGDEERAGWSGLDSRAQKLAVTSCYIYAKLYAARIVPAPGDLPIRFRQALMEQTRKRLEKWFAEEEKGPVELRYVLDRPIRWARHSYAMEGQLTFTIKVRRNDLARGFVERPVEIALK